MKNVRTIIATALISAAVMTAAPAWAAAKKSKLDVEIREWNLTVSAEKIPAGEVEVSIKNKGEEAHELVFIKLNTKDPVLRLPVDKDGALDETNMPFGKLIDEVEGMEPGKKAKLVMNLKPGRYGIFCNMVETEPDGTIEAHYSKGMAAELTVE